MRPAPASLSALRSRSGLRRALLAYSLYSLIEVAIWLAIILFAYAQGGVALAGLVAVIQVVPAAIIVPPLVSVMDRLPRGTALVLAHGAVVVTTLLTTLALLADAPLAVVIAASTTATMAVAVVRPIHFSALPHLADSPAELVSANSLSSIGDGIAAVFGTILAGVGAQIAGPWLVFAGATVTAIAATLLCLRLDAAGTADTGTHDAGSWLSAVKGLGALWGQWAAITLLLVMSTKFVIAGALDVLVVAFSETVLLRGQAGAGLILGAVGVGGLLGAIFAGSASMRRQLTPVVGFGGLLQGLGVAIVVVLGLLLPTMAALAVCGFGGAILMVSGRTLLQRAADDKVLARVFAVQESTSLVGLALGSALAPVLIAQLSPAGAFLPFGIGVALFTIAGLLIIRRLDEHAVFLPAEMALLREVPFLAVLPPYELERLAHNAIWMDVASGDDVIRQGEPGELLYVIGAGEFAVTIDGSRRPGTLGAGRAFGEIALLHRVPRTATITALSDGRLLTINSDDFLAAVTGSADGHAIAQQVSASHLDRDEATDAL